jgi:hypothetical protein
MTNTRNMKYFVFTLLISILIAFAAQAATLLMPLDTVREKSTKNYIFGTEAVDFSILSAAEDFIEEPSRKMTMNNLKSLSSDYLGYKLEIARVYHKPLEENDKVFAKYKTVMVEKINDNIYVYLIGEFKSERGAQKFIQTLENNRQYIVVKYKNGLRVDMK